MDVMTRLEEYRRWHWLQRETQDIDPVYPVLRQHMVQNRMDNDMRAWLILLHVAYYHLGSAAAALDQAQTVDDLWTAPILNLPCSTERRGHRNSNALHLHFKSLLKACERYGGPYGLLCVPSWADLTERATEIHGNGRWAAYKLCEMAQKVLGIAITPPDAAHQSSTGPRQGLVSVLGQGGYRAGNTRDVISELDRITERLAAEVGETDLGYLETSLCDYHSLVNGRYYLGHDIDQMLSQLYAGANHGTPDRPNITVLCLLQARLDVLPLPYLGELTGRIGPDKDRKRVYARTGRILERS